MNVTILEPFNRIHLPRGIKVLALHCHKKWVFLGLSNGDLAVYRKNSDPERKSPRADALSVKSSRSFNEVRGLFLDNDISQAFIHEITFKNATKTLAPIVVVSALSVHEDVKREILLIGTAELLQVYEWVGPYLNEVWTFDEVRPYSDHAFASISTNRLKAPEKGGQRLTEEQNILLISSRKKVFIYLIVRKSRNIHDFQILREISFKERIRKICAFPSNAKALVATAGAVSCINLAHDLQVLEVCFEQLNSTGFIQSSSLSYFGLSDTGPLVYMVPINDNEALFVRNTEVGTLSAGVKVVLTNKPGLRPRVVPSNVMFLLPCYVIFIYSNTFEVVDLYSGESVQTFKFLLGSGANICCLDDLVLSVATKSDVFQFNAIPVQKQVDLFLSMRGTSSVSRSKKNPRDDLHVAGVKQAISLTSALQENDQYFAINTLTSGNKQKQLHLRNLYKEYAFILFDVYGKFYEALAELACEWMAPVDEVLSMFPDFVNGILQIEQVHSSPVLPTQSNPIKRVTLADLRSWNDKTRQSLDDSDERSRAKTTSSELPRHIKNFYKAVESLIVYLTEQRRVHLNLLHSEDEDPSVVWKNVGLRASDMYPGIDKKLLRTKLSDSAAAIDTSLFLCYYYTRPMMLGPLLRLPHNRCNARVVNDCLLHSSSFDSKETSKFTMQLLDFYFSQSLHEEALGLLNDLESKRDKHGIENGGWTELTLHGTSLLIHYLQRLSNDHLDLIFKHSKLLVQSSNPQAMENARLIFMNDSSEAEGYDRFRVLEFFSKVIKNDDMSISYLEWVLHEGEDFDKSTTNTREMHKLSTRLCLLYLKKMASLTATGEDFQQSEPYLKMTLLLAGNIGYEPWTVLKNIPASDDNYLRLTVYIYHRLGEHQKLVDILYNQLGDLDGAFEYCARVYDEPNGEESGQKLFFKLLEDLLMHYEENQDGIARLLSLQGGKFPTLQLIMALPNSFPLHKLLTYLKNTDEELDSERFDTRMKRLLYKIGSSRARYEMIMAQAASYCISGHDQQCPVCEKLLEQGITCVNLENDIVHYACLENDRAIS